jgi:hypothetical protein
MANAKMRDGVMQFVAPRFEGGTGSNRNVPGPRAPRYTNRNKEPDECRVISRSTRLPA